MAVVQNIRSIGATTIVVDTVAGIPPTFMASMGTPHTFTDPVTSETITVISEATCVDFAGHVNGANLEIDTIAPGYSDLGSGVGNVVIIRPTTQWGDNVAAVLLVGHNDDGTVKLSSLNGTASSLTAGHVTTNANLTGPVTSVGNATTVGTNAITAANLATSAILLGYAQITSNFTSSQAAPTYTQLTGLSAAVTVPAGGRGVKVTVFCHALSNTSSNVEMGFSLWAGVVGSGTQLQQCNTYLSTNTLNQHATMIWYGTPSAGSVTYNVGINMNGGTTTVNANSSAPAFILVEAV